MKFEEKIKQKFLYSKNLNLFKVLYFYFQLLKSKYKIKKSYSNWGIDMMADFFFRNKKKGVYIDVGCHHPFINNNTYPLYKKGWRGINIDLDYGSIDLFNYLRNKDLNIQIAVSNAVETKELYFYHNKAAKNTLSINNSKGAKEVKKIKTNTLNNIIENSIFSNSQIDFISIDVEGHEQRVLEGFNLKKYKPSLVILELIQPEVKEFYHQRMSYIVESNIYKHMLKENYRMINWIHNDLVFVPNDHI